MKVKKQVMITADILVDEDFNIWRDLLIVQDRHGKLLVQSDEFEVIDYYRTKVIDLEGE